MTSTLLKYDPQNLLTLTDLIPASARDVYGRAQMLDLASMCRDVKQVLICGMGGSGICGDFLKLIADPLSSIPILVNKSPFLPAFVDQNTLLIGASYSGNTAETLACCNEGLKRNARLLTLSTGGILRKMAKEKGFPCLELPVGKPPRASLFEMIFGLLGMLQPHSIFQLPVADIQQALDFLNTIPPMLSLHQISTDNPAIYIANSLLNTLPLLWGVTGYTDTIALRWKNQLSENSKMRSQYNTFPELTHNEIVDITARNDADAVVVDFSSGNNLSPLLQQQIHITQELVAPHVRQVLKLPIQGQTVLEKQIYLTYLGDYVSIYLALMQQRDPTEIQAIDTLKQQLKG